MPPLRWLLLAALAAGLAVAPAASATSLLNVNARGTSAKLRTCHARVLPAGASVRKYTATAADTGLLLARLSGDTRGDWDLAVFGAAKRFVAAAAGPTSREVASGFVTKGERLTIQACLARGERSSARLSVKTIAVPVGGRSVGKVQILAVKTPTRADRDRLLALGFDDAEGGSATEVDIVAYGLADLQKLRAAGFSWRVKQADLVARERERAKLDKAYAQRTQHSNFPSGRTDYRHLADYEAELKALATKNPGLVKLITLNHKSLQGRTVVGVEIAQNVNVRDGKPVMMQMGVHHAREWPAGEHTIEWAYELINGYGKNERVTKLVDTTRTIVVPIVNPDGFNLSREAPVDLGNPLAMIDLPPDVDSQLPISDPTYTAAILADENAGFFAYKRRNCRIKDGQVPAEGECENSDNRTLGVDPNRNYGNFWGGPGASVDLTSDTYRGAGPFSEPETQNIRELVSANQVTTLITNHTFTGLVLRAPGLKTEGLSPDEGRMKALGDAMAANNGYVSQYGWQLYDTTGTTEDWSYYATGGYGYTFEIGPDEFHPPYEEVVAEYDGHDEYAGKGNRAAYFLAQENAADPAQHSVLRGQAPAGATLRVHKEFLSQTSPVIKDATGITGDPIEFPDVLDDTITVGDSGRFEWHVNQSTRPFTQRDRTYSNVAEKPAIEQDISSPTPVPPGVPREIEFEVKPEAARQIRASISGEGPDYDLYLFYKSVADENQVASSAGGSANETIVYDNPEPGKYVLQIVNFSAVAPYDGKYQVFAEVPGSKKVTPAHKEAWTLTCERGGKVLASRKVEVDRGAAAELGNVCAGAASKNALRLSLSVPNKRKLRLGAVLARGLRAIAKCSAKCTLTAQLKLDSRTAKRLGVKPVIAHTNKLSFKGRKTLRLRPSGTVASKVRRLSSAKLTLTATGRDRRGVVRTRSVKLTLRR